SSGLRTRTQGEFMGAPLVGSLGSGDNELHADGRADLELLARGRELAALRIDTKHRDGVGRLVAGQQKLASRIDAESARRVTLGRDVLNLLERTVLVVDGKHADRVVPAI